MTKRKTFSKEFKLEAVRQLEHVRITDRKDSPEKALKNKLADGQNYPD